MENLDQIQLLYINLALLMFTSSLALYLPKRLNPQINKHNYNFHPEIVKFYQALNQSLKFGQPVLTYIVDPMPTHLFISFYKGLKNLHGFKVELKAKLLSDGRWQEYVELDLQSYTGPRNVEPALYEDKGEKVSQLTSERNSLPQNNKTSNNVISILSRRKVSSVIETFDNNVVDLNSYRKNRAISYYTPDDNEGA